MDGRDHAGGTDMTPWCPQCGGNMVMVAVSREWSCRDCFLRIAEEVLLTASMADDLDVEVSADGRRAHVKRRPRRSVGEYFGYPLFEDPALAPGEVRVGVDLGTREPQFTLSVQDLTVMSDPLGANRLSIDLETKIRREIEQFHRSGAGTRTPFDRTLPIQSPRGNYQIVTEQEARAMDQFQQMVNTALLRSAARLLPPPEFRMAAERQAAKLGMRIEWKQERPPAVGENRPPVDADAVERAWAKRSAEDAVERSWATIHTRRGDFDVEPTPEQPWWSLLAEFGIDVRER